jgi:hypothetical protein
MKHNNIDTWARPIGQDDIQSTMTQQILPIKVLSELDFTTWRKPIYVIEKAQEIGSLFGEIAGIGK